MSLSAPLPSGLAVMRDWDRREFKAASECCQCALRTGFDVDPGSWRLMATSHETSKDAFDRQKNDPKHQVDLSLVLASLPLPSPKS